MKAVDIQVIFVGAQVVEHALPAVFSALVMDHLPDSAVFCVLVFTVRMGPTSFHCTQWVNIASQEWWTPPLFKGFWRRKHYPLVKQSVSLGVESWVSPLPAHLMSDFSIFSLRFTQGGCSLGHTLKINHHQGMDERYRCLGIPSACPIVNNEELKMSNWEPFQIALFF